MGISFHQLYEGSCKFTKETIQPVDRSQLRTTKGYECSKPNKIYCDLGEQVNPVVRDMIELNNSINDRCYEDNVGKIHNKLSENIS